MTELRDKDAQRRRLAQAWLYLEQAVRVALEDGDQPGQWVESVKLAKDHCEKALKLDP
jgi:hypothetical protein